MLHRVFIERQSQSRKPYNRGKIILTHFQLVIKIQTLTRGKRRGIFFVINTGKKSRVMKFVGFILLLFISFASFSHPRDSVRAIQRERARIERKNIRVTEREREKAEKEAAKQRRKREKIMRQWDQRSIQQRRNDRQALLFLAMCAGVLVHVMTTHHE